MDAGALPPAPPESEVNVLATLFAGEWLLTLIVLTVPKLLERAWLRPKPRGAGEPRRE